MSYFTNSCGRPVEHYCQPSVVFRQQPTVERYTAVPSEYMNLVNAKAADLAKKDKGALKTDRDKLVYGMNFLKNKLERNKSRKIQVTQAIVGVKNAIAALEASQIASLKSIYPKLPANIKTLGQLEAYSIDEVNMAQRDYDKFTNSCLNVNYDMDGTHKDPYNSIFKIPKDDRCFVATTAINKSQFKPGAK